MNITSFSSVKNTIKLGKIVLCLLSSGVCQAQSNSTSLATRFPSWQIARWEVDCKTLDISQVAAAGKENWAMVSFSPDFPGGTIVEERATKNPSTGAWQVLPGTNTNPLIKGKYELVERLSVDVKSVAGSYRYEATPGLTGLISGPVGRQNYIKGDPRFIGGYALARLNDTQDATQFDPVFTLPPQLSSYVKPIVQEYRSSTVPIQKQLESSSWLVKHLKSPNPLWRIIALRTLLQSPKLQDTELKAIQDQLLKEEGLQRAIFVSLIVDSDRQSNRFHNFLSAELIKSLNSSSDQDVNFLLDTLINSEVLRTNDPITGKEDPGFGPSLLLALSKKIISSDANTPLASENRGMLKMFNLSAVKVNFPPPIDDGNT